MNRNLLVASALGAALTLFSAPAAAQHAVAIGIPNANSPDSMGAVTPRFGCLSGGDRHHRGNHSARSGCDVGGWIYDSSQWALYNNRSWEPDSYNDWWHDRPDRAFPRWVQEQRARGTCDPDRMWWSGSGWHC
jgi:hypothetical protein